MLQILIWHPFKSSFGPVGVHVISTISDEPDGITIGNGGEYVNSFGHKFGLNVYDCSNDVSFVIVNAYGVDGEYCGTVPKNNEFDDKLVDEI